MLEKIFKLLCYVHDFFIHGFDRSKYKWYKYKNSFLWAAFITNDVGNGQIVLENAVFTRPMGPFKRGEEIRLVRLYYHAKTNMLMVEGYTTEAKINMAKTHVGLVPDKRFIMLNAI